MSERYAPEGKVWLCMMCGKTAKDMFGEECGWDESCAINCIAVDEGSKRPTEQQVREFSQARERRLAASLQSIRDFSEQIKNGTYKPDPELLALAERAIARIASKEGSLSISPSEGAKRGMD